MRFVPFYTLLALLLFMVGTATYAILTTPNHHLPTHPSGNCALWIKQGEPVFVCDDQGEVGTWMLHRNGKWQYLGHATPAGGVPQR